ncbi:MAG: hypothetical protein GF403_05195 [Candidatus Coatesbacteria bacterium]|nr:hypothetical protein [Candidatus Coatesbacteria bacterium]
MPSKKDLPRLTTELLWGGSPTPVRLQRLCLTDDAADFELELEEPFQPHWSSFKSNLQRLGFQRDDRHTRYDRFRLGSTLISLTRDGRLLVRQLSPVSTDNALAVAALFLAADTTVRETEVDDGPAG